MTLFLDSASNFHPYECNGPGLCIHCDRIVTPNHDPRTCALCQPDYEGAEMSGIISEAADTLETVAEKISSIDLSQEQAQVAGILSAAAATLGEVQASLRGFVEQVGEPQSVPQAATVDNPAEPPEGNVLPEQGDPGDEPAEGATEIENEPGAE